jgi:hypothetical protein
MSQLTIKIVTQRTVEQKQIKGYYKFVLMNEKYIEKLGYNEQLGPGHFCSL